jgi:hypothetical protein
MGIFGRKKFNNKTPILQESHTRKPIEFDANAFFSMMYDFLRTRFPYLKALSDDPDNESWNNGRALAQAVATRLPSLERVMTFSMWMSRDFMRKSVGITDEELGEIGDKVAETRFWPAFKTTIQQWNSHAVIIDELDHQKFIYEAEPWNDLLTTHILWQHKFGGKVEGPNKGGKLEVVFHENAIKCWARDGRFQGKYWNDESEDEYEFIRIPLNEEELNHFLVVDDHESVDAEMRFTNQPWDKTYYYKAKNEEIGWELHVLDNIAKKINWMRSGNDLNSL